MNSKLNLSDSASTAAEWYTKKGENSDIVLSTRVRLARNLADFPFPQKFRTDDSSRVQTLVFDAFLKNSGNDSYQTIAVGGLNNLGAQMLLERGLIKPSTLRSPGAGIVMRINGKRANSGLVCTVNDTDHVRISNFVPGMSAENAYTNCHEVDMMLQKNLQFAASYDFGYLTANVKDCGSGMKITARIHLPSTTFLGVIPQVFDISAAKGIIAGPAFGTVTGAGAGLGNFYQLNSNVAGNGSELEQTAFFRAAVSSIVETERRNRDIVLQKRVTEATDKVLKSYAVVKFSLMMDLRQAIEVISDIKWGKNLGIINGVEDSELTALLYRVQEAHLRSVIKGGSFDFPMDIGSDEKKQAARLRAIILQETFENIKITE